MENLHESIDLDIEEKNELHFKVVIEGTEAITNPAKVRLVCESGDMSYMFSGHSIGDSTVEFVLPVMKDKIKEGICTARVEVLVENRYFTPVQFDINFKKKLKVFAESVTVAKPVLKVSSDIKVSAAPIIAKKQEVVHQIPIETESKKVSPLKQKYLDRKNK